MKVNIQTTGCRTNQAESEDLAADLERRGFDVVYDGTADIYVVNACTVTTKAERHARNIVYRAKKANPGAMVVLTGCLAERLERFPEPGFFRKDSPDLIVGNREKAELGRLIGERFGEGPGRPTPSTHNRRLLKVQEGCSRNCAYCIVPLVRGRSRSVDVDTVLGRVRELEAAGASEIVVTGTHLGLYGRDLRPRTTLTGLIKSRVQATTGTLIRRPPLTMGATKRSVGRSTR